MEGNPSRSAPFLRNAYSISASSWYSNIPGRAARMAALCPSAVISMARRRRISSSASLTTRMLSRTGRRSATGRPAPSQSRSWEGSLPSRRTMVRMGPSCRSSRLVMRLSRDASGSTEATPVSSTASGPGPSLRPVQRSRMRLRRGSTRCVRMFPSWPMSRTSHASGDSSPVK